MPSTSCIHIQPFGHNKHGPKTGGGGSAPPFWEGERGPHLTQSRIGPRPTSISSGILIYAAIWPERIWAENGGYAPLGEGELGSILSF